MRKFPITVHAVLVAALVSAPTIAGCAAQGRPAARGRPAAGARATTDAPREQTADQQVRHALNRLAFGPRPGDYERVRAMGVDKWIDQQLHPERLEDASIDEFLKRYPTLTLSAAELYRDYPQPNIILAQRRRQMQREGRTLSDSADKRGQVLETQEDSMELRRMARESQRVGGELVAARVARAVASERQLQEVMVDFWENHFNVFIAKGPVRYFLSSYERDAIRPHTLGKFRDLLGAVAHHPAMLFYLDNFQSVADSGQPTFAQMEMQRRLAGGQRPAGGRFGRPRPMGPPGNPQQQNRQRRGLNENYARELLELHTLGVDGGYTQQDVIEVARALTGWSIDQPRGELAMAPRNPMTASEAGGFVFRPLTHDAGPKVVLGHRLPAGRGMEDGEEVLDILARHPATARFIATKLARRFVSDSPPPALIDRATATFLRTDGDIREVVRTIVTSPEFFSAAAYRSKVKSPFELVVSTMRIMGGAPDSTPRLANEVARLGQPLFGHQAPNGYPETGDAWINTGAILNRINFGISVAAGRAPGLSLQRWAADAKVADGPRDAQVDGVIRAILGGEASPDTRRILELGDNPLLSRAAPDSVSMVADAPRRDMGGDPAMGRPMGPPAGPPGGMRPGLPGARGRPPQLDGFAKLVGLALGAPEFQRR